MSAIRTLAGGARHSLNITTMRAQQATAATRFRSLFRKVQLPRDNAANMPPPYARALHTSTTTSRIPVDQEPRHVPQPPSSAILALCKDVSPQTPDSKDAGELSILRDMFTPPNRPMTGGEFLIVNIAKAIFLVMAVVMSLVGNMVLLLVLPGALPSEELLDRMSKLPPKEADALYEREHAPIVPGPFR